MGTTAQLGWQLLCLEAFWQSWMRESPPAYIFATYDHGILVACLAC